MRVKLFERYGREFVEIAAEGESGSPADVATARLFERFEAELHGHGLSLDDTVRIRVWGRDRAARALATAARAKILTDKRKAASSSFISQQWFESDAAAGMELLAMKPTVSGAARRPVEFEPPRNYLCYLRYDSLLFFSGFTADGATLAEQVPGVTLALANAFAVAGASWSKVVKLSVFLRRGQKIEAFKDLLAKGPRLTISDVEFNYVDGFAGEKYLLEIEATATI